MADNDPVSFNERSAREIARTVVRLRPVLGLPANAAGGAFDRTPSSGFWVKVLSSEAVGDTWRHTATEVIRRDASGTDWEVYPDDRGRKAEGGDGGVYLYASGKNKLADDAIVFVNEVVFIGDDAIEWWTSTPPASGLFPVLVSQTGGSNGNQTTAATWTYNVTDVASNPIAGGPFSPSWQRAKGKKIAANHGNGYYDPSGNFVLEQVDEVDDTGHC